LTSQKSCLIRDSFSSLAEAMPNTNHYQALLASSSKMRDKARHMYAQRNSSSKKNWLGVVDLLSFMDVLSKYFRSVQYSKIKDSFIRQPLKDN